MHKEKQPYEAPALTVVTFRTERGYAASTKEVLSFDIWDNKETDNNVIYDYDNESDVW